jgi:hypothetical protein
MCIWYGPREGKFVVVLKVSCRASLYFIRVLAHHTILSLSKSYGEKLLLKFCINNKEIKEEMFSHMQKLLQCCVPYRNPTRNWPTVNCGTLVGRLVLWATWALFAVTFMNNKRCVGCERIVSRYKNVLQQLIFLEGMKINLRKWKETSFSGAESYWFEDPWLSDIVFGHYYR